MQPNNKKENQRYHAKKRLKERFDLKYSNKVRQTLIKQIQNNNSVFLGRQSDRISIHLVKYGNQWLKCIYDRKRQEIVTFLFTDNNASINLQSSI